MSAGTGPISSSSSCSSGGSSFTSATRGRWRAGPSAWFCWLRVVRGRRLRRGAAGGRRAALVFPLSFLFFGLGFFAIPRAARHRALHGLIAGTAVSRPGCRRRPPSLPRPRGRAEPAGASDPQISRRGYRLSFSASVRRSSVRPGGPDARLGRRAGGMARPRLEPADGWLYQAVTSASEIVQAHSARATTLPAQVVIVANDQEACG